MKRKTILVPAIKNVNGKKKKVYIAFKVRRGKGKSLGGNHG